MTINNSRKGGAARKAAAIVSAVAVGMLGALGLASSAAGAVPVGNIDPDAKGSITVHKFEHNDPPGDFNPDGSLSTTGFNALDDVVFTVYKVSGLELTDADDWAVVPTLAYSGSGTTVTGTGGPYDLALIDSKETDSGVAPFTNLDLGVYLVVEGADNGSNGIVGKAAPFFVTVPLPDDNAWLYNVHVYPKNSLAAISKTVDTSETVKVGDVVEWPVTVKIPQLAAGQSLASFSISDDFDPRLGSLGVVSVQIGGDDVDYDLEVDATNTQRLIVTPDIGEINAHQGEDIVVVFTSVVTGIGDGTIENDALVHLPNDVNIPSNKPWVKFGAIKIEKYAMDGQELDLDTPLDGAAFALYETEAEADAALEDGTVGTPVWTGSTVDGIATTIGLFVTDSTTTTVTSKTYYLVETAAPAGYDPHPAVIAVVVTPGSIENAVVQRVGNVQKPPVELPLTGSNGAMILSMGGFGLLAIAAGAILVAARRRHSSVSSE